MRSARLDSLLAFIDVLFQNLVAQVVSLRPESLHSTGVVPASDLECQPYVTFLRRADADNIDLCVRIAERPDGVSVSADLVRGDGTVLSEWPERLVTLETEESSIRQSLATYVTAQTEAIAKELACD